MKGYVLEREESGVVEHDVMLPVQFFHPSRRRVETEGERRLLLAVLEDAILCYQKNVSAPDRRGQRLFREAEGWIMGDGDESLVSFETACSILDIDPDYLRRGLGRWRERELARVRALRPTWPIKRTVYRTRLAGH